MIKISSALFIRGVLTYIGVVHRDAFQTLFLIKVKAKSGKKFQDICGCTMRHHVHNIYWRPKNKIKNNNNKTRLESGLDAVLNISMYINT